MPVQQSPALCIETTWKTIRYFSTDLLLEEFKAVCRDVNDSRGFLYLPLALNFTMKVSVEVKELIQTQEDVSPLWFLATVTAEVLCKMKNLIIGTTERKALVCYLHASSNLGAVLLKSPSSQNEMQNISNMYWSPLQSKSHRS